MEFDVAIACDSETMAKIVKEERTRRKKRSSEDIVIRNQNGEGNWIILWQWAQRGKYFTGK